MADESSIFARLYGPLQALPGLITECRAKCIPWALLFHSPQPNNKTASQKSLRKLVTEYISSFISTALKLSLK